MDNVSTTQQRNGEGVAPKPTLGELFLSKNPTFPAKLPDWNGFWFKAGEDVLVFTEDDRILITPDYEQFGESLDWEGVHFNKEPELATRLIKALRKRTDSLQNKLDTLLTKNREVALASTALQLGFMWMGKLLGELGNPTPYPKASDPNSPVIEQHADKSVVEELFVAFGDLDNTGIVKGLRKEVELTRDIVRAISLWSLARPGSIAAAYPPTMAIDKSLSECIMWLGQQLHNIKVAQDATIEESK